MILVKSFLYLLPVLLTTGWGSLTSFSQDDLNLKEKIGNVDSSGIFTDGGYYTWCSSVIKGEDGKYHMFYSRWPHGKRADGDDSLNYIFDGFRGWLKYSEIAYAVSDKMEGPYHHVKTVLKGDGDPSKWDRYTMHNPQIRKFGKYYYLYYISNSFDETYYFKDSATRKEWHHWLKYNCTQSVGVIRASSLKELVNGNYFKPAEPVMKVDKIHTFEVATNPTVTEGPDGKYYMMFKSRKPNVGNMTFWMARADKPDQPFTLMGDVFTSSDMACEDPCLWYDKKRKRFYAAVKNYSESKKIAPQFGALALITSEDGLHWQPANNPLISLREMTMKDGRKIALTHLERPFVVTDKSGQPLALFAAASIGDPFKGDVQHVEQDNNTFNVCFPLRDAGKKRK